jgi:hypothetical protein
MNSSIIQLLLVYARAITDGLTSLPLYLLHVMSGSMGNLKDSYKALTKTLDPIRTLSVGYICPNS